jgi:hypothetical protein
MFSLLALQFAMARCWIQFFTEFVAFCPAEHKAAADAALELARIVQAHASSRHQGAENG